MSKAPPTKKTVLNLLCWVFCSVLFLNIFILSVNNHNNLIIKGVEAKALLEKGKPAALKEDLSPVLFKQLMLPAKKKKTDKYYLVIQKAADQYQIDPHLIKAIIMTESSYNPRAVSHRGAKGLMQLMPGTAKELGVEDCFNPALNIDGGVRYFKKLLDRFGGDVALALAAYNAGSTKVRKYKGVPPFKATKHYIKQVNKYYQDFKDETVARMSRV